jgi:single-strand DNA-binding protein
VNKTIITGNVGREPEMRYTPSGQAVTSFSVAVNKAYTNSAGEKVKQTLWFRVSAWGKLAEVCNQYVVKGMKVLVEGELLGDPNTGGPKTYTKQDGTVSASFELTAHAVEFLGGRNEEHAPEQEEF